MNSYFNKFVFLAVFCLNGCNQKNDEGIEIDKMSKIIADLQVVESKISRMNFTNVDSARVAYTIMQDSVYRKYHVDSITFAKVFDELSKDKSKMWSMYNKAEKILDKINKRDKTY